MARLSKLTSCIPVKFFPEFYEKYGLERAAALGLNARIVLERLDSSLFQGVTDTDVSLLFAVWALLIQLSTIPLSLIVGSTLRTVELTQNLSEIEIILLQIVLPLVPLIFSLRLLDFLNIVFERMDRVKEELEITALVSDNTTFS